MKSKLLDSYRAKTVDEKRVIKTTGSFLIGAVWAITQFVFSFIYNSVFLFSSSLFSASLSLARLFCVLGYKKDSLNNRRRYLILSSLLVVLGRIFYGTYNIRFLFGVVPKDYGLIPSISIALFSFTFFTLSVRTLIKDRKNNNDYMRNMKIIAFISSLVNIMLTQMCLLMATDPDVNQKNNMYFAMGIGVVAIILGIYLFIHTLRSHRSAAESI